MAVKTHSTPKRPIMPKVSLIVCTRNRASQLEATLRSIQAIRCGFPWELVVVDNGSTDSTNAVLMSTEKRFTQKLIRVFDPRKGLGNARNSGVMASNAEIIAFTDDDCYPANDCLESIARCFEENERYGYIGGRILLFDRNDYPISIQESTEVQVLPPGSFIPAGLIQGANLACRRTALESVGGFDSLLGAGTSFACEDVEVLSRMSSKGWFGAYDPRPVVYHHHRRRKRDQIDRLVKTYDRGRGAYYAACILKSTSRREYIKNWYWLIRSQPASRTLRELVAGLEFLLHYVEFACLCSPLFRSGSVST